MSLTTKTFLTSHRPPLATDIESTTNDDDDIYDVDANQEHCGVVPISTTYIGTLQILNT